MSTSTFNYKGKTIEKRESDIEGTMVDEDGGFCITDTSMQFVFEGNLGNEFGRDKYYVFVLLSDGSFDVTLEEQTGFGPKTKFLYGGRMSSFRMNGEMAEIKASGLQDLMRNGETEDATFFWFHDGMRKRKCSLMFDTLKVKADVL